MKLGRIKNQVVVTTLVVMLAISGYISFRITNRQEEEVLGTTINDDMGAVEEAANTTTEKGELEDMEDAGEAVITSTKAASDYAATARINREQTRAKAKEELQKIIDDESLSQEARQNASDAMVAMCKRQEAEVEIETLLAAKGFENVVVCIGEDSVDVVVDLKNISDKQLIQIEEVVTRKTEVDVSKIVVTPLRVE